MEPEAPEPTASDLAPREPRPIDLISVGRSPGYVIIHLDITGDSTEGGVELHVTDECARELKRQLQMVLETS